MDGEPRKAQMNDCDLVRAIQGGDGGALTILYERYVRVLWRYVSARLQDQQKTEDLVSETFLAAIRTIGRFDPQRGTVHAWLQGIARNKLRDHWRKANRSTPESLLSAVDLIDEDLGDPQAALIASETGDAVVQALDTLKDEERLALEWKYLESLSVREMAERLGRSERAIEAVLYRARRSFLAAFAPEQTQVEDF